MATKQVKRHKPIKHPFSKAKLRVLDEFSPPKGGPVPILCPACRQPTISTIMMVEGDYYVLDCGSCKKASWFVQVV